jgi:pimeloyl-ACP methyl ester carboxylesterase
MMWIGLFVGVVALVIAGRATFRWMMERPLFVPGTVEQRIARRHETLDPPANASFANDAWQVTADVALRHVSIGRGQDVLVVHGGPGLPPASPWKAATMTNGLRWHFYDQRGCGDSTRPYDGPPSGNMWQAMQDVEERLGMAEQLADIERIRRLLGRERLVLVGHSFGSLIAMLYAAEWPDRVAALILVAPAPLLTMPVEDGDLFALIRSRLDSSMQAQFDTYMRAYFDFPALLQRNERELSDFFSGMGRFYAAATRGEVAVAGARTVDANRAVMTTDVPVERSRAGGFMTLGLYLSLGRRHDWTSWLKRITAPTVVFHGANDLQSRTATDRVARAISNARVIEVPEAGHFIYDEVPEAFAAAVESTLRPARDEGQLKPDPIYEPALLYR